MNRLFLPLFLLLATWLPALGQTDGPGAWPARIRLGIIPVEGGSESKIRFEPLQEHLQKTLGIPVEIITAGDYAGVITAMAHNHVQFAFFGPRSYVEAAERAQAEVVAMELDENGNPGYSPIIIARKASGIRSLADAKGKTFVYTDPNSTSGYLVPAIVLSRDLKLDPERHFSRISFSGSHGASILAVKNGNVDVAATNDSDLARMTERGAVGADEIVIIHRGNPLPGAPMVCRRDLPASLKAAFLGALLQTNRQSDILAKMGIGGYALANDSDYDIIRYLRTLQRQLEGTR